MLKYSARFYEYRFGNWIGSSPSESNKCRSANLHRYESRCLVRNKSRGGRIESMPIARDSNRHAGSSRYSSSCYFESVSKLMQNRIRGCGNQTSTQPGVYLAAYNRRSSRYVSQFSRQQRGVKSDCLVAVGKLSSPSSGYLPSAQASVAIRYLSSRRFSRIAEPSSRFRAGEQLETIATSHPDLCDVHIPPQ
jgi:hypothetical protein